MVFENSILTDKVLQLFGMKFILLVEFVYELLLFSRDATFLYLLQLISNFSIDIKYLFIELLFLQQNKLQQKVIDSLFFLDELLVQALSEIGQQGLGDCLGDACELLSHFLLQLHSLRFQIVDVFFHLLQGLAIALVQGFKVSVLVELLAYQLIRKLVRIYCGFGQVGAALELLTFPEIADSPLVFLQAAAYEVHFITELLHQHIIKGFSAILPLAHRAGLQNRRFHE